MLKHAASHGLSVFVCTILSSIIVEMLKPLLPNYFIKTVAYTEEVSTFLGISISPEIVNTLLLASLLGVIWGIFFKLRFVNNKE